MTRRKLSDTEALALWREAERRLRLVDTEPAVSSGQIDALLELVGRRREGESLAEWLDRSRAQPAPAERPSAQIIPFNPRRQRFAPVAEIVRLAADSSGPGIPLPTRELETTDGRFRLTVASEADQVVISVQALGFAADEFGGRSMGLAGAAARPVPIAVFQLDEDGDGQIRLPDSPDLRRVLLAPVLGLIEDL